MTKVGERMYEILTAHLENGLKVILHKVPACRTVACGVWVRQGSKHETDESSGLSHLIEHLKINTANTFNPVYQSVMADLSSEGIVYNAKTTKEATSYYMSGLKGTLERSLLALSEMVINNNEFSEELFENEKKVVFQEGTSYYSSFNQIKERTSQALWGNIGIGRVIAGNISTIKMATQKRVKEMMDSAYTPANSTVIVVGGIDYEETMELLIKYFEGWKDKKTELYKEQVESEPSVYFNKSKSGVNSVVSLGFRTVSSNSENRLGYEIISRIMGDSGLESRIVKEIRMDRGLAYNVGSFARFYEKRGTIGFTAVCQNEKVSDVVSILMEEFRKIQTEGITDEELRKAKNMLETKRILELDSAYGQLAFLGKHSSTRRIYSLEDEMRNIRNVDHDYVKTCIDECFKSSNMGVAAIGNINIDNVISLMEF